MKHISIYRFITWMSQVFPHEGKLPLVIDQDHDKNLWLSSITVVLELPLVSWALCAAQAFCLQQGV